MEKVKYYTKEITLFLVTFVLFYFLKDAGSKKYLILLTVTAVFGLYGMHKLKKDYFVFAFPPIAYILFGMMASTVRMNFTLQSIKEIAFVLIPLISAVGFFVAYQKIDADFIKFQYWSMILLTLTRIKYYYIEDIFETQYAFVFGVFLMYFCIIKKDWKYVLLTTVAMYFMNKRIAMLSAVLILIAYDTMLHLIRKNPLYKKKIPTIISYGVIVACVGYVVLLCSFNLHGQFFQDLTSGRSVAWAAVKEEYGLSILWLGKGLGDVVNLLKILQIPSYTTNLHNDLLKVFIETGSIGYLIWLISHFLVCFMVSKKQNLNFDKKIFAYLTMAYSLFNYATDNILVYVNYWFPVYFVLLTVVFSEKQEEPERTIDYKKEHRLLLGVVFAIVLCLLGNVIYVYTEYRNPSKFTIPEEAAEIYSPEGVSRMSVWVRDGQPYYRIRYGGKTLIEPSVLGVESENQILEKDVEIDEIIYQEIVEREVAVNDEENPIKAAYQPVLIKLHRDEFCVELEVRVYDYGVAFRYILPENVENCRELTQIRFAENSILEGEDLTANGKSKKVSTEEIDDIAFLMPVIARFSSGEEMKIFELSDDMQKSKLEKSKWKKRTVSIILDEGNTETIPWRGFEILTP